MLDGLEITQFTYFQQCGGIDLDLVPAELTYGLERIVAFLQNVESVYDIEWAPGVRYRDVRFKDEQQFSVYNFELADVATLWKLFDLHEKECQRLLTTFAKTPRVLPAYDQALKCSHLFNLLDSRGAISVTERVGVIGRVRRLALGVAKDVDGTSAKRQLHERPVPARNRNGRDSRLDDRSCNESSCRKCFKICSTSKRSADDRPRVDATPRRLVLRAEGLVERQADTEELMLGPPKSAGAGALHGFAKKMGTTPDQLGTETTAKGEYFALTKRTQRSGRQSRSWRATCLNLILKIQWPKTMYWNGKGTERFIRPIRWIVALLGDAVVPFEIAGVMSGNIDARSSTARQSRDSGHHRELRATAGSQRRNPVRRRATRQDRDRDRRAARRQRPASQARSRAAAHAGLHHRVPYPDPRWVRFAISGAAAAKCWSP